MLMKSVHHPNRISHAEHNWSQTRGPDRASVRRSGSWSQCVRKSERRLPMNLVAADVRRLILFRLKEVGASSRRLLRFRGLTREISGKSLPDGGRGRVNDVFYNGGVCISLLAGLFPRGQCNTVPVPQSDATGAGLWRSPATARPSTGTTQSSLRLAGDMRQR